jgi:hypothetical protein
MLYAREQIESFLRLGSPRTYCLWQKSGVENLNYLIPDEALALET